MFSPLARLRDALPAGISRRWLRRLLVANLVGQVLIVLSGGIVRLTGSGLGCPTFPQCVPGSYIPVVHQPQGIHKFIEFGNRMLTTVLTVLAVAAVLAVLRRVRVIPRGTPGRRSLLLLGWLPFVGVAVQALIGGVTVLTELNPTVVAVHFLVSMGLIAGSTLLVLVALPAPVVFRAASSQRALGVLLAVAAAVVLALGTLVTGSGPHSGDADDPNRFGFDITVVARLHSGAVWVFTALLVTLMVSLTRSRAPRRAGWVLVGITVAQGVLGYVQYALGVPIALVALHMLGAATLAVSTTVVVYQLLRVGRPALGEFGPLAGEDEPHEALPVQR